MTTYKQKLIYQFIKSKGEASLQDIASAMPWAYYYNQNKHFGDVLSRMVRIGLIERIKPGVFKLSSRYYNKSPTLNIPYPQQLEMFEY